MQTDSRDARDAGGDELSLNARLIGMGLKKSYASHLATGKRKPSLALALDLEKKLGIPPAAWRQGVDAVKAALATATRAEGSAA